MSSFRPSAPRLLPGTILAGKYRIERLLAEGAMGMVLEATDTDLGKPVAIKVLRADRRTPELEARFDREVRIAQRLESEHLARVDGAGHSDLGDPFLVMELLSGRDLAAELADRGPLPVAEAVDVVLEACAGVAEAHAAGLVHRDLKPANLFVARRREAGAAPSIKVLDFGLTKVPHEKGQIDLTATESNFGTPQYMSPEQIHSAKHVDARTDQHALGAVLHELLTGQPPFTAPNVTQLAVAIAVEEPPHARAARPEVPPALDRALRRALGKLPDDRFPDLLAFADAIAPFGGDRAGRALHAVRAALGAEGGRVVASVPPPASRGDRDPGAITTDPRRALPGGRPRALSDRRAPRLTVVAAVAALSSVGAYRLATLAAPPPALAAPASESVVAPAPSSPVAGASAAPSTTPLLAVATASAAPPEVPSHPRSAPKVRKMAR